MIPINNELNTLETMLRNHLRLVGVEGFTLATKKTTLGYKVELSCGGMEFWATNENPETVILSVIKFIDMYL